MNNHPPYFPTNCPPITALDPDNVVFRIVESDLPNDDDFLNYNELGIGVNCAPCGRCGISVYNSHDAAIALQKRMPRLGNFIAKGTLDSTAGKISSASQAGHHEWWPYDNIDRHAYFSERIKCKI